MIAELPVVVLLPLLVFPSVAVPSASAVLPEPVPESVVLVMGLPPQEASPKAKRSRMLAFIATSSPGGRCMRPARLCSWLSRYTATSTN